MKVLSGHTVAKLQSEDSVDPFIMSTLPIQVKSGPPHLQQTVENDLTSASVNENINRRRWRKIFRRVQRKNIDSDCFVPPQKRPLFGQSLSVVCERDGSLPKPIMEILSVVRRKGPSTLGVFRKAGNSKAMKEIKEQINNGMEVDLKEEPVILLADLLKDFLRHLPGSLLRVEQYQAWMRAMENKDKCTELQLVIKKLPELNIQLLKHLIVVLYHISVNAEENKMDSSNLAVCVSPNLLQVDSVEMVENVKKLTQFLIDNCCKIFGEDLLTLLEDSDDEELSDNHDSLTSLCHDSAYESNDPDVDGFKGSYTDMHAVHSVAEKKTADHFQVSTCPGAMGRQTVKPYIRRCSEPTIVLNQSARNQPALTRSQTEMDFYGQTLTKQISDECVLFKKDSTFSSAERVCGEHRFPRPCKIPSHCSSSSLESTFSSASESSIHTSSPIISSTTQRRILQRKLSFPTHSALNGNRLSEGTKKRSQSMKAPNSRNKPNLSRVSSSKRAEKALRQSQTLSEVLLLTKPRHLSSEEVFEQCDSRIPSDPPSYEQAIQGNIHVALSRHSSLTVEAARCLSKYTCCQSTFPTTEKSDSSSRKNCNDVHSCESGEKSLVSATSLDLRKIPVSETMYEKSKCCGEQVLEAFDVRESYV